MKHVKQFAQVAEEFNILLASSWRYRIIEKKEQPVYSYQQQNHVLQTCCAYPDKLFLNCFNRFQFGEEFHFSIIQNPRNEQEDKVLTLIRNIEKRQKESFEIQLNQDLAIYSFSNKTLDEQILWQLIDSVFSDAFISEKSMNPEWLAVTISENLRLSVDKKVQGSRLHNIRIVEERGDIMIILLINPRTMEPKLCYKKNGKEEISVPATAFYAKIFRSYGDFWQFFRRNFASLHERGASRNISNNEQLFHIIHHTHGIATQHPFGMAISSGKAQLKFLCDLTMFLSFFVGPDNLGNMLLDPKEEVHSTSVEINGKPRVLKFGDGTRIYSMPEYDIVVQFGAVGNNSEGIGAQLQYNSRVMIIPYPSGRYNICDDEKWRTHWFEWVNECK